MGARMHAGLLRLLKPGRVAWMDRINAAKTWGPVEIRTYQEQRLSSLVRYCWDHVPYYRSRWKEAISHPADIRNVEDLQHLPIIGKDEFRREIESLCTTDPRVVGVAARTGGSTGRPVAFQMTQDDDDIMWAQMYVAWSWAGYRLGAPFLAIGGESIGVGLSDRRRPQDWAMNRWITSGSNLTLERTRRLVKLPMFGRIEFIYGYPNAIREFCEFLAEIGKRPRRVRGVVCTAEVMRPEIRSRIAEVLGNIRVHDQYGLNDGGLFAAEGPSRDGLHVFPHRGILEVVGSDGSQIWEPHRAGRAIGTCLTNRATPFVRYETGDEVHWYGGDEVSDGCRWPRIGPVDGRTGDVIYLPSGRRIAMPGLTLVMRWLDGLRNYQFIQTSPAAVTARVLFEDGTIISDREIVDFLRAKISDEICWDVVRDEPVLTPNGKVLIIRNDWLRALGVTRPPAGQETVK